MRTSSSTRPGATPASAANSSRVSRVTVSSVPHRFRGVREVVLELLGDVGWRGTRVDRLAHVEQPAIALRWAYGEREVTHSEARMAALEVVGARAAPVLGEEQRQPVAGTGQVLLRIERPNDRVGRDAVIEAPDETLEERHAADTVVQREGRVHDPQSRRSEAGIRCGAGSRRPR